jgi:hypothetical protein
MNHNTRRLTGWTAAVVTTAAFAKTFLPFYLIGSTTIFVASCALGVPLVVVSWRPILNMAIKVADFFVILAVPCILIIANFLIFARPAVPTTHLAGILIFHASFIIFGFSAARALRAVLLTLLSAGVIYSIVLLQYVARFGDVVQRGYLQDVFGVGDPIVFGTFHQNIGIVLGFAALAGVGLASNRLRQICTMAALPLVGLIMFHISARGALVALICSLLFLVGAAFWVYSRRLALTAVLAVIITATSVSALLYQRAIHDKDLYKATDAFSRTVREI